MSDKQAWEKKLEAQLEEWRADIAKMEARSKKAGADAQADYERELKRLRKLRDESEDELKKVRAASESAWQDMRKGAEASWDAMTKAMRDAWSRFG